MYDSKNSNIFLKGSRVFEGLCLWYNIDMKIFVVVKPGSSQEKIVKGECDSDVQNVTIWTHARAHDGEANKKVIEMLAKFYDVPKTSIRLVRGETSKQKVFEI